mmetsp:Transcript_16128/g.44691  ORF Transcript_16128/g.44691 Transcript_16128/m.44691 type:complete len:283 (+) Transcript_16128:649-1497(+)
MGMRTSLGVHCESSSLLLLHGLDLVEHLAEIFQQSPRLLEVLVFDPLFFRCVLLQKLIFIEHRLLLVCVDLHIFVQSEHGLLSELEFHHNLVLIRQKAEAVPAFGGRDHGVNEWFAVLADLRLFQGPDPLSLFLGRHELIALLFALALPLVGVALSFDLNFSAVGMIIVVVIDLWPQMLEIQCGRETDRFTLSVVWPVRCRRLLQLRGGVDFVHSSYRPVKCQRRLELWTRQDEGAYSYALVLIELLVHAVKIPLVDGHLQRYRTRDRDHVGDNQQANRGDS